MKKKDNTKVFWYLAAIGFIILFILILLSSVLDVGDRLSNVQIQGIPYLTYAFYAIVVILVYALIIRPIHIIVFSPSFSIETTLETKQRKNYLLYKRVAKRLLKTGQLKEASIEKLNLAMKDHDQLKEALNHVFNNDIKKTINKTIQKHAKTVMISTAISQNGRLDFFTVIVVNIKMIKEIVQLCGFRPSFSKLAKLTINVFTTALIAEGLEDMDITQMLPQSTFNTISELPLIKPLMSSVTQGVSNALLTLRIGIVTRKYLFTDAQEVTKEKLRRDALLEATGMLPTVIGDATLSIPKKFANMFKKNDKNLEKEV